MSLLKGFSILVKMKGVDRDDIISFSLTLAFQWLIVTWHLCFTMFFCGGSRSLNHKQQAIDLDAGTNEEYTELQTGGCELTFFKELMFPTSRRRPLPVLNQSKLHVSHYLSKSTSSTFFQFSKFHFSLCIVACNYLRSF